jgi:two-component system, chemotaxis family, chemotaxis protein CheY
MSTILIVDDSSTIRRQVAAALTPAGFHVVEADDGEDALMQLLGGLEVALVICDVNMPKLSGLDLLERLRTEPSVAHTLVLMLTTEGQPESIARAKALGAKGWMVKPFVPALLVGAVQKLTAGVARPPSPSPSPG